MANTATFPLTGHTYTDDSDPNTGLDGGGHVTRFVPALADVVLASADVVTKINTAYTTIDGKINTAYSTIDGKINTAYTTIDDKVLTGSTYMDNVAASVAQSPSTSATSLTSLLVGEGSKSLTLVETGKAFIVGQTINISNSNATSVMVGVITAFNSITGTMTVNVTFTTGSGTLANWIISLGGSAGKVKTGSIMAMSLIFGL